MDTVYPEERESLVTLMRHSRSLPEFLGFAIIKWTPPILFVNHFSFAVSFETGKLVFSFVVTQTNGSG